MPLSDERFSHYEDKKSEILFSALSDQIRSTRNLVEDLVTCPKEKFLDILNTKVRAINESASVETQERFLQLQEVEKEIERLQMEDTEAVEDMEAEMNTLEPLYDRWEKIYKEDKRYELRFLENIQVMQASLTAKYKQAEQLGTGDTLRKNVLNFLRQRGVQDLVSDDIMEVGRDTAFTVRATISASAMEKHFRGNLGIFFGGSPVFIVKESPVRDIATENHERLHAVTEGLLRGHPLRHVTNVLSIVETMYPTMGGRVFTTLGRKIPGKYIVDGLHGEIVAALEQAFETDFASEKPTTGGEAILHLFLGMKKGGHDRLLRTFETAGVETIEISRALDNFKKGHANEPKLVAWVESMEKELVKEFRSMARGIESANDYINLMYGDRPNIMYEARLELLTLACFLKPSQYRHADAYMHAWKPPQHLEQEG